MDSWLTQDAIIGLSPMDGITDSAFRYVVDIIGTPDVLFSEFISSEGLVRNVKRLFQTFASHKTDTPFVAQLFGSNPDSLAKAALMLRSYDIAGIDINMGCPMRTVASHGGGAGLISKPALAQDCIRTVKQALIDAKWHIPLSVKTRTGIDKPITQEWIGTLAEAHPDAIILHGRTLKQMYTGSADWQQIGIAASILHPLNIPLIGNGDIHSLKEARDRISFYKIKGVLIGRAAFGNPWIFSDIIPTDTERIKAALIHLDAFERLVPEGKEISLRKHMAWYTHGLPNAKEVRIKIMTLSTVVEMREYLQSLLHSIR